MTAARDNLFLGLVVPSTANAPEDTSDMARQIAMQAHHTKEGDVFRAFMKEEPDMVHSVTNGQSEPHFEKFEDILNLLLKRVEGLEGRLQDVQATQVAQANTSQTFMTEVRDRFDRLHESRGPTPPIPDPQVESAATEQLQTLRTRMNARIGLEEKGNQELQSWRTSIDARIVALEESHTNMHRNMLEEGDISGTDKKSDKRSEDPNLASNESLKESNVTIDNICGSNLESKSTVTSLDIVSGKRVVECSQNLHAWCIVHATKHTSHPCGAVGLMAFSVAFILLQIMLLASVILESSFSRCTRHEDCHLGEWCSPALAGRYSTSPGVCFDCWSATMFYEARFLGAPYEVYPDPYELMADAAGDRWLHDGSQHCNETDTRPRRCDFLVDNLQNMTPLSMLILVTVAALISASMVDEIDEVEDCEVLLWHCAKRSPEKKHLSVVIVLSWFACTLRRWVLPMMTTGATLGLVLGEPLSASNLLLNGLAITFVTSLDDTLVTLIWFPQKDAEEMPKYTIAFMLWLFHRLYAVSLFAAVIGTVLLVEDLLGEFGNEAKYGAVCSDLREIVTVYSFYTSIGFAALHALLRMFLRRKSNEVTLTQRLQAFLSSKIHAEVPWDWVCFLAAGLVELVVAPFIVWYVRRAFVAQGPLVTLQIGNGMLSM